MELAAAILSSVIQHSPYMGPAILYIIQLYLENKRLKENEEIRRKAADEQLGEILKDLRERDSKTRGRGDCGNRDS